MPPSRWYTSSKPRIFISAVDFSQRMPPVQNMATLVFLPTPACSAGWASSQAGSSVKVLMLGLMAPLNVPMTTS